MQLSSYFISISIQQIIEKMLITRLLEFFARNNVRYDLQYGFRRGSSTSTAITELVDDLIGELEKKQVVGALFLDLKKAFDTLDHDILLSKLESYGIRGIANEIISSYLSNRQQFVQIENDKSTLLNIETGVPQGSNIGPLLFLIYVNDIYRLHLHGVPRLFADDTALFYPRNSPRIIVSHIEQDLVVLMNYFNTNLLSLNISKTKYMIFHSPRKKIEAHPDPRLEQIYIEKVEQFKYLGVHFDSVLSWDYHIKQLVRKTSVLCGFMKRVRSFVTNNALLKFYYACIHSQFQYLTIVWGHACKSKLSRLQVLQNRCLKIVFNLPHFYPTRNLYSNGTHYILPIRGLCEIQTLILVHNVLFNETAHHNLDLPVGNRLHNTRQANNLQRARATTNLDQTRLRYEGPLKFNALPNDLKNIRSTAIFKARLKVFLKQKSDIFLR